MNLYTDDTVRYVLCKDAPRHLTTYRGIRTDGRPGRPGLNQSGINRA